MKTLKVQIIEGTSPVKPGEKVCYLTWHIKNMKSKAELLEYIVDNPTVKIRVTRTNETFKLGQWYEET